MSVTSSIVPGAAKTRSSLGVRCVRAGEPTAHGDPLGPR